VQGAVAAKESRALRHLSGTLSRVLSSPRLRSSTQQLAGVLEPSKRRTSQLRAGLQAESIEDLGFQSSSAGAALVDWVLENGGHIHQRLEVVENAPCGGGRGIVSTMDISAEDAGSMPLILVPDALYLTSQVARFGFQHYVEQGAPAVDELDQTTQLAVLLAHEKGEGEESFYFPYIAALPQRPPCAWAMDDSELQAALASIQAASLEAGCGIPPEELERWKVEAMQTRESLRVHSDALYERYAPYFRSEVTADTYFWALGMVVSRAFSSHPELGLAPLIDIMNHRGGADHPEPVRMNGEDEDDIVFYVTSARNSFPAALGAGEELHIQYVGANTTPKESFLSYGFVPSELWR